MTRTPLAEQLGSELPLIQAPMAGYQGAAMAVAVSQAGGLGSLGCAVLDLDRMRAELRTLQAGTTGSYNVNFFCHRPPAADAERQASWLAALAPYYRELGVAPPAPASGPGRRAFDEATAEVLAEFRPPVVSFHFGLPSAELVNRVRGWGATILASATTVEEAQWLEAHGADAVIAQGLEAGGHRGHFLSPDLTRQLGTMALVPQIVHSVRVPVIAAGGIADAAGVRAAMALGASGVQVGTAYLLTPEATITKIHRTALHSEAARHTALTRLFTGRPARGIVNRLMRELEPSDGARSPVQPPAFPLATAAIAPLRAAAEALGSGDFSPLWAGQNVAGGQAGSAADITAALAEAFTDPQA